MRSKKKKLLFICFSALIMVGLCIGVFADYNSDRIGTILTTEPYDIGELVVNFDDSSSYILPSGYYIAYVDINADSSDHSSVYYFLTGDYIPFVGYYNGQGLFCYYLSDNPSNNLTLYLDSGSYFIYFYTDHDVNLQKSTYYSDVASVSIYSISDEYTIDIYDNSQDVWASVASIVDDATESVINNDILLLFAAAVPVISFGVGMLIRLYHKS